MRQLCRSALAAASLAALGALPLAADDAAPPAEAARPPISQIEGTAPVETPQERMERFKRERGAGSDRPFDAMAAQAEADMQAQRDAAIGSSEVAESVSAAQSVEDYARAVERLQDELGEIGGGWGGTPCTDQEPDWAAQHDWVPYRKLARGDFQSEDPNKLRLTVAAKKGSAAAYLALVFSCVVTPNLAETRPGVFTASLGDVRYFVALSRKSSYLIADFDERSYAFQHEQQHFDIAHQLARWLNQSHDAISAKLVREGRSEQEALGRLQLAFGELMLKVQRDARALDSAYDRATLHGLESSVQTQWNFRIQDGLEAIAKGVKLETRAYTK